MLRCLPLTFAGLLLVSACTQFPELEGTVRPDVENASFPELVRLEPLLAQGNDTTVDPIRQEADLQGRVDRLRARAGRLRGTVLSTAERQRLEEGLR